MSSQFEKISDDVGEDFILERLYSLINGSHRRVKTSPALNFSFPRNFVSEKELLEQTRVAAYSLQVFLTIFELNKIIIASYLADTRTDSFNYSTLFS